MCEEGQHQFSTLDTRGFRCLAPSQRLATRRRFDTPHLSAAYILRMHVHMRVANSATNSNSNLPFSESDSFSLALRLASFVVRLPAFLSRGASSIPTWLDRPISTSWLDDSIMIRSFRIMTETRIPVVNWHCILSILSMAVRRYCQLIDSLCQWNTWSHLFPSDLTLINRNGPWRSHAEQIIQTIPRETRFGQPNCFPPTF